MSIEINPDIPFHENGIGAKLKAFQDHPELFSVIDKIEVFTHFNNAIDFALREDRALSSWHYDMGYKLEINLRAALQTADVYG
ncbi:MAG: hypothetical protein HRU20_25745 [Pseudomonadales bacterium]|nr:hypothetical protein [Pseudomonadales bacterium]